MLKFAATFDPGETKDYVRDWTAEMDAVSDTITATSAALVTENTGLSVGSVAIDASQKKVVMWLTASNATQLASLVGTVVIIAHTITTAGGRFYKERIGLKIMRK